MRVKHWSFYNFLTSRTFIHSFNQLIDQSISIVTNSNFNKKFTSYNEQDCLSGTILYLGQEFFLIGGNFGPSVIIGDHGRRSQDVIFELVSHGVEAFDESGRDVADVGDFVFPLAKLGHQRLVLQRLLCEGERKGFLCADCAVGKVKTE